MTILVTGAAGFIGSRLSRRLVEEGLSVVGVDNFTDYYPRWIKDRNLAPLRNKRRFSLVEADLAAADLSAVLKKTEAVFHLAAQAGVRASWGAHFSSYVRNNIEATQRLLEAAKDRPLRKFVFASSSSVYGLTRDLPMTETSLPRPVSPYGVSKLAAEHLSLLYHASYGLPAVALRFFTVYGTGQRPDMAFHKFFKAMLEGRRIPVYGDGRQTRDFTFVDDIVEACLAALDGGRPGRIYNIGGGHRVTLDRLFAVFERISGRPVRVAREAAQRGDVRDTFAAIDLARRDFGFSPRVRLDDGLRQEWEWVRDLYLEGPAGPDDKGPLR
jgi:nucleoside-diphosphate-sugar epimerase